MKIINKLRDSWNDIPNSVKFWNVLLLLILVVIGIYSTELLGVVLVIGSLLAWAVIVDGFNIEDHLWIWFTPFMWLISVIGLIIVLVMFISTKTIEPFNDWLNNRKGE